MATKIGLYNAALREIGGTRLSSLTEAREPRYALDDVYDDALLYCLEQGQWNFAVRAVLLASDPSIAPAFGYDHAFAKPDDWVRTAAISANETFTYPLIEYTDENGYWWANDDPIYLKYISSDINYGLDLTRWPPGFTRFVELYLARKITPTLVNSASNLDRLEKALRRAKIDAQTKDAMNQPPGITPPGSWSTSRGGTYSRDQRRAD